MIKTLALAFVLALAACGGKKPEPAPPPGNGGGGGGDGSGDVAGPACSVDTDCAEGQRCDTCPSTCPPGTEVCAAVCGPAVCVGP
jgi:hypothetical protein